MQKIQSQQVWKQKQNYFTSNQEDTLRRDSIVSKSARTFASKTNNMSSQNNDSGVGESSNLNPPNANSIIETTKKNQIKNQEEYTFDRRLMAFATKVFNVSNPISFISDQEINLDRVQLFLKQQFHQVITVFQYNQNIDEVEFVALKYITFMAAIKQNSALALVKLQQLRNKHVKFSFFFYRICQVIHGALIEQIKARHVTQDKGKKIIFSYKLKGMSVDHIWRLEQIKENIVDNIVNVLKVKRQMWENLESIESQSLDKLLRDVLRVSIQVEHSRLNVVNLLNDFTKDVQFSYTYYHKYKCFKYLFFDANYRKAALYQRKMEDAWQISKSSTQDGIINNYQWLQGNLISLEVSLSLFSGQIIKGVNQRLADFLGYKNLDELNSQLRLRASRFHSANQNIFLSSILPQFLMSSHEYFTSRFLNRGWSTYIKNSINSFICNAQGFIQQVHIHLQFNFNTSMDFTMLGGILKEKETEQDYLIFDEWGRILGVSERTFNRIILKHALQEFGMQVQQVDKLKKKQNKRLQLQEKLADKIAQDTSAKLFKKAITTMQKEKKKEETKRTYIKPSDIVLKFGSIQHFLPQIGKIITEIIGFDIFKQMQSEGEQQFNKIANGDAQMKLAAMSTKMLSKQISMLHQQSKQSFQEEKLPINIIDKAQYRNYIITKFLDENGLMQKNNYLLQDEKLVLYSPKNYNELIEYYNDAGNKYMEAKQEWDNRTNARRQNVQLKANYIEQQQNCYNLFDVDFQEFIDTKVKRYYSKALLKEALETNDRFLESVRYKVNVNVQVGLGGINEKDQFLYFVCKLSNLNQMMAKRNDVIKIHLKKERQQKFDGDEDLRRSLIKMASDQDSIPQNQPPISSFSSIDLKQQQNQHLSQQQGHNSLLVAPQIGVSPTAATDRNGEKKLSLPEKKKGLFSQIKKKPKNEDAPQSMMVSLKVPDINNPNRDEGPNIKVDMVAYRPKKLDSSDLSVKDSYHDLKSSLSNISANIKVEGEKNSSDKEKPKPKIGFLRRMEKGIDNPNAIRKKSSASDNDGGGSFAKSFFAHFFERLNLRKLSQLDFNQNDAFDQNPDAGFEQNSEESEKEDKQNNNNKNQPKKSQSKTPSGSNSMSSNNFSGQNFEEDDEDLKQIEDDELANIFEVMSQASNNQSVKSISAISMATNISKRCAKYMPEQAQTLQFFKIVLVVLNILALIILIYTIGDYFDKINVDSIDQVLIKLFENSCLILQSQNSIQTFGQLGFNLQDYPPNTLQELIQTSYNESYNLDNILINNVGFLNNALTFPLEVNISIPGDYQQNSLKDILSQQRIELDALSQVEQKNLSEGTKTAEQIIFENSIDLLMDKMIYQHTNVLAMLSQIHDKIMSSITYRWNLIIYIMVSFAVAQVLVILVIVPFIKQINLLYEKVLVILSRLTMEECQDEIRKLTLCQHLLETNDDSWVTQNQVKLVFYNRSKELDLEEKYKKYHQKKKDNFFFSFRLQDTKLSVWRDMTLYILMSLISIAYLIFAIIFVWQQTSLITPYVDQYSRTIMVGSHLTAFISKMNLIPYRLLPDSFIKIPQLKDQMFIELMASSMKFEQQLLIGFNGEITRFIEEVNLDQAYRDTSKLKISQADFEKRLVSINGLSSIGLMNHILKDNLCYYSAGSMCIFSDQIDFFNTGLIGAMDQLVKLSLNHDMSEQIRDEQEFNQYLQYFQTKEYKLLTIYGQLVISKSFSDFSDAMKGFIEEQKMLIGDQLRQILLGIGIPLVFMTFLLAMMEMQVLRKKVERIMFSITYLPTFKFQDKIVVSLIKGILKI